MYKRIEKKIRNKCMMELLDEQLFCNMFGTLQSIEREYRELSPVELWHEAKLSLPAFVETSRPDL